MYHFSFDQSVPIEGIERSFMLAQIAVRGLYGRVEMKLGVGFKIDKSNHGCLIDGSTKVGHDLAKIFLALASNEFGEDTVQVKRSL